MKGHERGGAQAARAWSVINATHTALEVAHCFIADGKKKGQFRRRRQAEEGKRRESIWGGRGGSSSLENLHAMVAGVGHDDAPVAVDGDAAIRMEELSVA